MKKYLFNVLLFLFIFMMGYGEEIKRQKVYAVLPFSKDGNVSEDFIKGIMFKIEHFLTNEGEIISSRTKINEIIEEKKLLISAISDSDTKEIGAMLSADYLITGFIEKRSGKYMIAVQKIAVQSGRIEDSYYIETSPEDVFFTKSAEYLSKKIRGSNTKNNDIFKEENSVVEIKNNKINVKKINVNYFDNDRYDARFVVVDCFGKAYQIKGELYVNGDVFDIYQLKGEKYPKTTEDIVCFMPLENKVLLTDGSTKKTIENLNNGYIKDDGGRKYYIKNARAVSWQNRINNIEEFLANYNTKFENKAETGGGLKSKSYNIETGKITVVNKNIALSDKFKIKAANFEGEISKDEIAYIIPSFYRMKLKNGFIVMYFSEELLGKEYIYDNQKKIDFDSIDGCEELIKEEIKQTLHSGNLDDPFYFDEIKEEKVKQKFKSYYSNQRSAIFARYELSAEDLEITDLSFLKGFLFLERLTLDNNKVKDLQVLKNLRGLTYLSINNNEVSDISPIVKLEKMETLNMANNKIRDLEEFGKMQELKFLKLSKNRIFDIEPLAKIINLEEIDLSNTRINDISAIKNLHRIRKIDISNNKLLLEIEGARSLKKLSYINISNTNIEDISPLADKIELGTVAMANTLVTNIDTLKKMKFLSYVNLIGNSLNCSDLSDWNFTDRIKFWNGSYVVEVEEEKKGNFGLLNGSIVKNY